MLSRKAPQVRGTALLAPVATQPANSGQLVAASDVHCTLVCAGLNFSTSTRVPQVWQAMARTCFPHSPAVARCAARLCATSASHALTARVVSTSNSNRRVILSVTASAST